MTKNITIESAGIRLSAVIDYPEEFSQVQNNTDGGSSGGPSGSTSLNGSVGKSKFPLCVIIHGITGNKEEPHLLAVRDAALRTGYITLRVDMYGHGESEGFFKDHTLYHWLINIMSVMEYVRELDYVSDIYLCGHSQGGCAVMLAAAMYNDIIATSGLIPLSPACHIPETCRRGTLLGLDFDPVQLPDELFLWDDFVLKSNYLRVAQTLNIEDSIDRYTGPVLIVHGGKDESVPIEYAKRAADRYKNSTFIEIPGDTHCFDFHMDELAEAVEKWLRERHQTGASN